MTERKGLAHGERSGRTFVPDPSVGGGVQRLPPRSFLRGCSPLTPGSVYAGNKASLSAPSRWVFFEVFSIGRRPTSLDLHRHYNTPLSIMDTAVREISVTTRDRENTVNQRPNRPTDNTQS